MSDNNKGNQEESAEDLAVEGISGEELPDRDADFSDLEEKVELQTLETEVAKLKDESEANKNNYLRALADFENYKKRAIKERSELLRYEGERLITDILDVMDNFERALEFKDADEDTLRAGMDMIHHQFKEVFDRWQIKAESGLNKPFNPHCQSAISNAPSADVEPGTVVQELKKPYFYKDKLIRQGEVVVSEAPKEQESEQNGVEG